MKKIFFLSVISVLLLSCKNSENNAFENRYQPKKYVELKHPDWTKNATIYEVNVRQYTNEGTFKAFETHLPRLKKLGVDIIWLMPIHPIGVKNRKGTLGSEYSVKDYYDINPEYGNKEDFKRLVDKIHSLGMYVVIDWVANHSAWDNELTKTHPDWYTKNKDGNFQPTPWYDWDDVVDFDYENPEMRKYMTDAMKFWVKDFNIDGYRCDVAGFIPVDFWDNVRAELDAIKPIFMLAEWESRDMHKKAFDMTYSWTLFDKMKDATTNNKGIAGLVEYMAHDQGAFPKDGYRMTFTDNHDMNSWNGTPFKNFGKGLEAAIVFSNVVNGMPLIYSGQEAGLNKSLKFFDKDSIEWKEHPHRQLFTTLNELKHVNQALWNGENGGPMVRIYNNKMDKIVSFSREKKNDKIIPIINFSDEKVTVILNSKYEQGTYKDLFSGQTYTFKGNDAVTLNPWGYLVLVK
jgi:glycosidase